MGELAPSKQQRCRQMMGQDGQPGQLVLDGVIMHQLWPRLSSVRPLPGASQMADDSHSESRWISDKGRDETIIIHGWQLQS